MTASLGRAAGILGAASLTVGTVAAHAGSLGSTQGSVSVPLWLFLLTGGGVVGASFLFTSLVTDRDLLARGHRQRVTLPRVTSLARVGRPLAGPLGAVALLGVVAFGLFGPRDPLRNAAVLLVWAGWWAGYTTTVYLFGNTWPALNPWRTAASHLERWTPTSRSLPTTGTWVSVAGLLALVWLEVVAPVSDDPRLLAGVVVGYSAVTLAGAALYGSTAWFGQIDPVARVFAFYGRVAPLRWRDGRVVLTVPGLASSGETRVDPPHDVAFVVALLWVTTYDGLVTTPLWAEATTRLAALGVPPLAVYVAALAAGFAVFLGLYREAARLSRRTADSYVTSGHLEGRFAASLLPIAAGYHLAHFLGYVLTLVPAAWAVALDPLAPPATVSVLVLPAWFGAVQLTFVVVGHLVAVWDAHTTAFDVFTGRLQPIRSQYPFILLMVLYTMTSMWIVTQPFTPPPFVGG